MIAKSFINNSLQNESDKNYRHPKISHSRKFDKRMKAFNLSLKNIKSFKSQKKSFFQSNAERGGVANLGSNHSLFRNEIISNSQMMHNNSPDHNYSSKNRKIKIMPLVQNLTRIDSCNRKLAFALNNNKLKSNFHGEQKMQRLAAKPTTEVFRETDEF